MSLSVLCVTNNKPHAEKYILRMHRLCTLLGAEFVLGLDGKAARQARFRELATKALDLPEHDIPLQEMVSDAAVNACSGDWVLRLDDDEVVSPALERWLSKESYIGTGEVTYSFPRVYMYPDENHYLNNPDMYPDLQTRLGLRDRMFGYTFIHAGNPNGPGRTIPYALEHHKLLCKTLEQRQEIARRYESIRPGAGTLPQYARYNLPELFYPELTFSDYGDGDFR